MPDQIFVYRVIPYPIGCEDYNLGMQRYEWNDIEMGLVIANDDRGLGKILIESVGLGISDPRYPMIKQDKPPHKIDNSVQIVFFLLCNLSYTHI